MPWIAAVAGVGLCVPALWAGLVGDDVIQRQILLHLGPWSEGSSPLWDLFVFIPDPGDLPRLMDDGVVPWWAHPELHIAFLRPVSSATHMLDYALWPDATWMQHLHSLLWYGLAVALAGLLYRDVHGTGVVAGLAVLLFAVEDSHSMPAGWLANRNALIALVLGLAALRSHLRWRRRGSPWWGAAAVGLAGAGLLAGEAALGALAYVASWQLTRDRRSTPVARLAALVPYGLLVVAWRLAYRLAGYGAHGSGLYIDPLGSPWAFTKALVERWPLLQGAQWLQIRADAWSLLGRPQQLGVTALGAAGCAALLVLLWPLLRRDASARFWALGSALALIPLCAAFPMDRLLLFAGLGAFALLAQLAAAPGSPGDDEAGGGGSRSSRDPAAAEAAPPGRSRASTWACRGLLLLHGPLAAVLLLGGTATLPLFHRLFTVGSDGAPTDAAVAGQTLVFVHGNEFPVVYLTFVRDTVPDAPAPRNVALLSSMHTGSTLGVVDAHTLRLTMDRPLLATPYDQLMRAPDAPFVAGQRVDTGTFVARVLRVDDRGRPLEVQFTFAAPLDDPRYRWLFWDAGVLRELSLPAPGESRRIEACSLLRAAWVGSRGRHAGRRGLPRGEDP